MAAHAEALAESGFVPLLPDGVRWGDISDAEDEEQAAAADGDEEFETDPKRLLARQQQIDFGKNTLGYERYLQAVPKHKRKLRGKEHDPPTPDITRKMSKRTWDGIVKAWRRHLHKFDNVEAPAPAAAGDSNAAAAAADMQVDAAPAMPDAPRTAAANSNRWRANKRRGAKPQHSSSRSRMRHDDTASQQRQEQAAPAAKQHSPTQLQHPQQQQADERDRQQHRPGGRREEEQRSSAAPRYAHHGSGSRHGGGGWHSHKSSSRDDTRAAKSESGVDHEREYGQPPRHNSHNSHNSRSAAGSSQEHRHGSGSGRPSAGPRVSSSSRGGGGYKGGSHQQQRGKQDRLPAGDAGRSGAAGAATESAGRRPADSAAVAGDLAGGSSRQLTPAKRGSSSQANVDDRPSKHC